MSAPSPPPAFPSPPPASEMATLYGNPQQFTFGQYTGMVAIACSLISTYTLFTIVLINEYMRKRRASPDLTRV